MAWNDSLQDQGERIRGTFGVPVAYSPVVGDTVTITGIFDKIPSEGQIAGQGNTGLDMVYQLPLLDVVLSDLATVPAKNDTCVIDGVTWKVLEAVIGPVSASLHLKR